MFNNYILKMSQPQRLTISSMSRSFGSSSNFKINFSPPLDIFNKKILKLLSYTIFGSQYNINNSCNQLILNDGSNDKLITLTNGYYSASDLASELQNELNNNSSLIFTVSYNVITKKLTFQASGSFILKFNIKNSIYKLVGATESDG